MPAGRIGREVRKSWAASHGLALRVAGQRPALPEPQTKSPDQGRGFSLQLVPETGVEPATYALRMRRSTN